MKWNLRNRILVPTTTLILVLTGVLSGVSYWMSTSALKQSMDDQLDQICASGLHQVESWIEGQRQNLVQWAIQPGLRASLQSTADNTAARGAVNAELSHAKQLYAFYEELVLADLSGATIACSSADQIGKLNVGDRQYFRDAAAGRAVVSSVIKSRVSGNPCVVIAAPVMEGGAIRGVLYGILDLGWFSGKFVASIKVLQTGYAYMFDEEGVFIAHPDKTKILTTRLGDFDWGRYILQTPQGEVDYTFEGVAKMARFRKSETLHWGFVATVPNAEMLATARRMGWINFLLGAGTLSAGLVVMFLAARSITQPILHASESLSGGADQITAAAHQVSTASQSQAQGASEQAASIEETSASLEEINSMTRRNAEHAQNAKALAQETRHAAEHGTREMDEMVTAMNAMKISADNIAKIVKSIDEIAFQTNILALNAAVEAARAGEAGLGFAVVAEEVRALAQRAAVAARETAEKIEDAIQKSSSGVAISGKAAESLKQIATKARQVDELVAEIATASQEQTKGLGQINIAVAQLDKVTQSNAASAEETAAAAEELNAQAFAARESVSELLHLVEGGLATVVRSTETATETGRQSPAAVAGREPRHPAPASGASRHRSVDSQVLASARNGDDLHFADV